MTETTEQPKVYIDSKEKCQSEIDSRGCVCSQCGGQLTPIETVDNSNRPTFWAGCENCSIFNYGVPPIVFKIAKKMVTEQFFIAYRHMDSPVGKDKAYQDYYRDSQIGGASNLVSQVLKNYNQLLKGGNP